VTVFLALVAFFPDWALVRATWGFRGAGLAFLVAAECAGTGNEEGERAEKIPHTR
jgi:hypothetical protein